MMAPPTNGHRILLYGQDSTLLHTRRLVLASAGFDVDTVCSLEQFLEFAEKADPLYELFILCHTVPVDERGQILPVAIKRTAGLYQLQRMEAPPRLVETASEIMANPDYVRTILSPVRQAKAGRRFSAGQAYRFAARSISFLQYCSFHGAACYSQ